MRVIPSSLKRDGLSRADCGTPHLSAVNLKDGGASCLLVSSNVADLAFADTDGLGGLDRNTTSHVTRATFDATGCWFHAPRSKRMLVQHSLRDEGPRHTNHLCVKHSFERSGAALMHYGAAFGDVETSA